MHSRACLMTLLLAVTSVQALEMEFKPSYLELRAEGLTQRVSPGEFVEVPLADNSSLEIELSPTPPRRIDITSKGESEFMIFGAIARLSDGGKMTATMNPETKKLDISWTKGEMKSPPGDFNKPAVVSFFTKGGDELLRPLEFSGVRPFGYTDELEGRSRRSGPRDLSVEEMPPLNLPPPEVASGFSVNRQWVDYETDAETPPPITLPPPLPPKKKNQPSQVLFLEPSDAKHAAQASPDRKKPAVDEETEPLVADSGKDPAAKPDHREPQPKKQPEPQKKESSEKIAEQPTPSPSGQSMASASASQNPDEQTKRTRPTLYEIVMSQEKKQAEVMKMIEDMSKQVEILKEKSPLSVSENQKPKIEAGDQTITFPSPAPPQAADVSGKAPASPNPQPPTGLLEIPAPTAGSDVRVPPPEVDPARSEFEVEVIGDESISFEDKGGAPVKP